MPKLYIEIKLLIDSVLHQKSKLPKLWNPLRSVAKIPQFGEYKLGNQVYTVFMRPA
ncbi:hypothetical protein L1278_001148 [Pontibacter sp. HSC-36F09]|nr:hypothetical protein [Pontibacter sp. HSC-36F09]